MLAGRLGDPRGLIRLSSIVSFVLVRLTCDPVEVLWCKHGSKRGE